MGPLHSNGAFVVELEGGSMRGSTSRPSPQSPKGILGSPPPRVYGMHAVGQLNSVRFRLMRSRRLVKKHHPRGKIYVSRFGSTRGPLVFIFVRHFDRANLTAARADCYVERLYWAHSIH